MTLSELSSDFSYFESIRWLDTYEVGLKRKSGSVATWMLFSFGNLTRNKEQGDIYVSGVSGVVSSNKSHCTALSTTYFT